jgi:hypothetical protein
VTTFEGNDPAVEDLRRLAIEVGSKCTLEVLAKAMRNSCMEDHISVLLQLISKNESFPRNFLEYWHQRDGFDYLFSLLLECTDCGAR